MRREVPLLMEHMMRRFFLGDRENLYPEQMNGRKEPVQKNPLYGKLHGIWEQMRFMFWEQAVCLSACGKWQRPEKQEFRQISRKIPVRQETIEICERFDLNPTGFFSEGGAFDRHAKWGGA